MPKSCLLHEKKSLAQNNKTGPNLFFLSEIWTYCRSAECSLVYCKSRSRSPKNIKSPVYSRSLKLRPLHGDNVFQPGICRGGHRHLQIGQMLNSDRIRDLSSYGVNDHTFFKNRRQRWCPLPRPLSIVVDPDV